VSWREEPSLGSVLRAVRVPPVGGDTLWSDMYEVYDGLPEDVQARIDGMRAVHHFYASAQRMGGRTSDDLKGASGTTDDPDEMARLREQFPPVEHPVVRTHPETRRRLLYVNEPFTSHIVGLDHDESEELLGYLCGRARIPEYQCRFRWSEGAVAFWDNRATQHYACSDYWPEPRVMERVTITGDRPF